MLKYSKYCIAAFVAITLVACGKTKDQQVQDHSKDVLNEYNALAEDVNAMGTPDVSWSNEKLDQYEAKINKLTRLDKELGEISGTHGVQVYGSGYKTLAIKKDQIAAVRRLKGVFDGFGVGTSANLSHYKSRIEDDHNQRLELGEPSDMSASDLALAKRLIKEELEDAQAIVNGDSQSGNYSELSIYSQMVKDLKAEQRKLNSVN